MSDQNKTINSEILQYWNDYYSSERRHLPQSLFAESVLQKEFLKPAYKLIDFGCGDGRDTTFLAKKFKVCKCRCVLILIRKFYIFFLSV